MAINIAQQLAGIQSPVDRIQEGVLFGQQQQDRRIQQEAAQAQAVRQKQADDQLVAFINTEDKTAEDYRNIIAQRPDLAEKFKASMEQLSIEEKDATINEVTTMFALLENGQIDLATTTLEDAIEAANNAGDEQKAKSMEAVLQTLKVNPAAAKSMAGMLLATATGDDFSSMLETLRGKPEADKPPTTIGKLFKLLDKTTDPKRRKSIQARIDKEVRSAGPLVTIEGDKPEQQGQFGRALVSSSANIIERGQNADATLNTVAEMRSALETTKDTPLETGALADFRLGIANFAQTFGISDSLAAEIASAEGFNATANGIALVEAEAMKGTLSDNDVKFLKSKGPELKKSGLGNEYLLNRMENVALMDKIKFNRGQKLEEENPNLNNVQVSKMIDNEFNNIPYIARHLKTEAGMPIFFASFYNNFKAANPEITVQEAAALFRASDVK